MLLAKFTDQTNQANIVNTILILHYKYVLPLWYGRHFNLLCLMENAFKTFHTKKQALLITTVLETN